MTKRPSGGLSQILVLAVALTLFLVLGATPAFAGKGGNHGPCIAGSGLGTLGGDVSFVARNVGTPLPVVFAFDFPGAPPPMAPGQLVQFARSVGLC